MSTNLEVKLRLYEIARKSAELSAIRSELVDMASQLDRLRKLNGTLGLLSDRDNSSRRKSYNHIPYRRFKSN